MSVSEAAWTGRAFYRRVPGGVCTSAGATPPLALTLGRDLKQRVSGRLEFDVSLPLARTQTCPL